MKKPLVVIDMQNDFISGSLGTKEAEKTVDAVVREIMSDRYDGIIVTQDTHQNDYLETQEGKNLPVKHCILETEGWNLDSRIDEALRAQDKPYLKILKYTFGSEAICKSIDIDAEEITLCGLCTDICVMANAMILKTRFTETPVVIVEDATAGVTPEKKKSAMDVLASCQIYARRESE